LELPFEEEIKYSKTQYLRRKLSRLVAMHQGDL